MSTGIHNGSGIGRRIFTGKETTQSTVMDLEMASIQGEGNLCKDNFV